jgi:hypothetical protein
MWAPPRRVTPGHDNADIMAVASGSPGVAYVGWLSDNSSKGFALYLRPFSIHKGWLARPIQVSRQFGNRNVWPGDTIGISLLATGTHAPPQVQVSWGSAIGGRNSQIFTTTVTERR